MPQYAPRSRSNDRGAEDRTEDASYAPHRGSAGHTGGAHSGRIDMRRQRVHGGLHGLGQQAVQGQPGQHQFTAALRLDRNQQNRERTARRCERSRKQRPARPEPRDQHGQDQHAQHAAEVMQSQASTGGGDIHSLRSQHGG